MGNSIGEEFSKTEILGQVRGQGLLCRYFKSECLSVHIVNVHISSYNVSAIQSRQMVKSTSPHIFASEPPRCHGSTVEPSKLYGEPQKLQDESPGQQSKPPRL
jgi:hypothetical protein